MSSRAIAGEVAPTGQDQSGHADDASGTRADRLAAVRRAAPDARLVVDANEAWSTEDLAPNLEACAAAGVEIVEQPLPAGADGILAEVRRPIPVCADESVHVAADIDGILGRYEAVNIKLDKAGGLTEALKITHSAETHYIDIVPHNPLGPVSAAACVQLCMASSNVGVQEMPRQPGTFATDLFPQQIEWEDGYAWAPDVPGLGVELNEEAAAANSITDSKTFVPRMTRSDGAFTNW